MPKDGFILFLFFFSDSCSLFNIVRPFFTVRTYSNFAFLCFFIPFSHGSVVLFINDTKISPEVSKKEDTDLAR
jgi:hypothetical protein